MRHRLAAAVLLLLPAAALSQQPPAVSAAPPAASDLEARRQAFARNEKSQHEPGSLTRHRCGSSCGCGKPAKTGKQTKRTVDLGKAGRFEAPSARKRPWMLGH